MVEGTQRGLMEFRASWRSVIGRLIAFLLMMDAFMGWMLAKQWGSNTGIGWLFGLLFGLWVVWLIGRQLVTRLPVVSVGPQGITGYLLRGHVVPWIDVADIRQESVQGHPQLIVDLVPDSPSVSRTAQWLSGRKPVRRIPLMTLPTGDHARVADVVLKAFAAYGGTRAQAVVQKRMEDMALAAAFQARLRTLTPYPWALYLVVALNVGVWLLTLLKGLNPLTPAASDLFRWGANSTWSVTQESEYWRLLAAAFLHGGVVHLALNMLGLWTAGLMLNRLFGNAQFLVIYLGSALIGNALSLHFASQHSVAVGASGAVFGILGALLVTVHRHRHRIPGMIGKDVLTSQGIFLVYSLVQGFTKQGVDNAAHVGGLIAGAAMACLLAERIDDQRSSSSTRRRQMLTGVAVGAGLVTLVLAVVHPGVDHRHRFEEQAVLARAMPQLQTAEVALQKDAAANQAGTLSDELLIKAIRERHLPAYRAVRESLTSLPPRPAALLSQSTPLNDIRAITEILIEMMELEVRKADSPVDSEMIDKRLAELKKELSSASERLKIKR